MRLLTNWSAQVLMMALLLLLMDQVSSAQGMVGRGGSMMGGEGMREMMQRMMGDVLPQPMDPADLPRPESAGAQLLQRFCTQCHYLYGPGLHTAEEWPAVVERMNRRMQMMSGRQMMMRKIEAPSPAQLVTITDYLQEHAQRPLSAARMNELQQTEGGQLFSAVCSRCHPLPDPTQHQAQEWPAVVERMKSYMTSAGQNLPSAKEMEQIIYFLQSYSGADVPSGKNGGKP